MPDIYLTNTLTKKKELFTPKVKGFVGIYSCGPTVYWNQHIGHMYAYVQWDILVRFLMYLNYKVKWVMNITDVGHMTSDEDTGEDKMEKGAKREGVSVWELADKYITQFEESIRLLNITNPFVLSRATKHISQQIELIKKIEERGFSYRTKMGVVFDTSKFLEYSKFANLDLSKQKKGEETEIDPEKKSPWDFFLWVTGRPNHIMQWESPWGKGYPGWHIECTAMSTFYLGENFDIHTGGIEHIPVHHTNEIAQGFGAFGYKTANFWLHNAWLKAQGEKMSKSLGNYLTVQDLSAKGYDPIALRYLIISSHYKKGINFSFDALDASASALKKLRELVGGLETSQRNVVSEEKLAKTQKYRRDFENALADDLNVPRALAVLWEVVKSNIPSSDKYDLAISFNEVLGLKLNESKSIEIGDDINKLVLERDKVRNKGDFNESDRLRKEIESKGFVLEDTPGGTKIKPKK